MVGGAVSASAQAISYVNDLSASAQAQLNALREGSATANNAVNARFANSASKATVLASLSGTYSVAAANVADLTGANTFTQVGFASTPPIKLSSSTPMLVWEETDQATNWKRWYTAAIGGALRFRLIEDALDTGKDWLLVSRSATTVVDTLFRGNALRFTNDTTGVTTNLDNPLQLNSIPAASYARLDIAQTFAKGTGSTVVAMTDGATITPNCENGNVHRVILGGNRTLAAPSNARSGQTLVFHILQDGTGGRTLAWNSIYHFAGQSDPTLSTAANAVDVFAFNYDSVSGVWRQAGLNVG
jgi:hypothetical protein